MAEDNPNIVIKVPPKPIDDTRELYLAENEKLIKGPKGFVFRKYQTLEERLQEQNKEINNNSISNRNNSNNSSKISRNMGKIVLHNILSKKPRILLKSKTQENVLNQPFFRFKSRSDLERLCAELLKYNRLTDEQSIKDIRSRHVKSIDFPEEMEKFYMNQNRKDKELTTYLESNPQIPLNQNENISLEDYKGNKRFNISKSVGYEKYNKKPKVFSRLRILNCEAKKLLSDLHFKTHFKGVESIFIQPKQISSVLKKEEETLVQKRMGNYAYIANEQKDRFEEQNEYKKDILDLIQEEKEKQKLISTKEFSNYLNNKEFFNDKLNNDLVEKDKKKEELRKFENMRYLKALAFSGNCCPVKTPYRRGSDTCLYNINSNNNKNGETSENQSDFTNKYFKVSDNNNPENKQRIKIQGKIFHFRKEIDKVAKEILGKCKFYNVIKK